MNNCNRDNQRNEERSSPMSEVEMQGERDVMPKNISLAMAYVPFQRWSDELFDLEIALDRGTIFPELYKPFLGDRRKR